MKASSDTRHAKAAEGKVPQRLPAPKLEEPSRRSVAVDVAVQQAVACAAEVGDATAFQIRAPLPLSVSGLVVGPTLRLSGLQNPLEEAEVHWP